jgi:MFS family permease
VTVTESEIGFAAAVGLPQIATGLGFSPVGLTSVIHAYALTFGGLLLLDAKLADRYGRRPVLLLASACSASRPWSAASRRRPASWSPPARGSPSSVPRHTTAPAASPNPTHSNPVAVTA